MASDASFNPRINIINSSAPTPEPSPESTGEIFWLSERAQAPGEGEDLMFEIDYDLSLFQSLFLNGKELALNEDYYLEEGSTIITVKGNYTKTLDPGNYSLVAKYSDGKEFATAFVISENPEQVDLSTLSPDTGSFSAQMFGAQVAKNSPFIISGLFILLLSFIIVKKYLWPRLKSHKFKRISFRTSQRMKAPNFVPKFHSFKKAPQIGLSLKPRKIIPIITGLIVISGSLYLCLNIFIPHPNEEQTFAAPTDQDSLSLSTSDGNFIRDVDLTNGNTFVSTSQNITVNEATTNGYKLFISTNSSNYNDLSINGSISTEARITSSSNTFSAPDTLETDSYGFAVSNTTFGTNYTPSASSKWAGVPALGSEITIKDTTSATPAGDSTTIYYGFNLTDNLPDGSYYGTDNSAIIYKAIATVPPTYTVNYSCNGGSGSIASQTSNVGTPVTIKDGSSCSKDNYTFAHWNTVSNDSGTTYAPGAEYNQDVNVNLYAIWEPVTPEPEPVTYNTFILKYDANHGTNAPAQQSRTTTESSASFSISTLKPTRTNYEFVGWCTNGASDTACSGTIYQSGATITISNPQTITLYAIWRYNGPVKVTSVAISGSNNILLNAENHTAQLTASVAPSNATNKTVTWSSSNKNVANITNTGLVTALNAGVTTITATANDGSGKKASFNLTVTKKVIILLGASQLRQINGPSNDGYANVRSYVSSTSKNAYTTTQNNQYRRNSDQPKSLNDTLNFIYYSGRGYQFETGENWSKDAGALQTAANPTYSGWSFAKKIINHYKDIKNYVEFYVYFTISGNDTKYYTCKEINSNASKTEKLDGRTIQLPTIDKQIKKYNDVIAEFGDNGFKIHGYVTSQHPMKASQGSSKYYVKNNHAEHCSRKYRSNYKYYTVNKKYSSYIGSNKYLTYVNTFNQIVDTSGDKTKWTFKSSWGAYNTIDGIHWHIDTAKRYFNFWLNLNKSL